MCDCSHNGSNTSVAKPVLVLKRGGGGFRIEPERREKGEVNVANEAESVGWKWNINSYEPDLVAEVREAFAIRQQLQTPPPHPICYSLNPEFPIRGSALRSNCA